MPPILSAAICDALSTYPHSTQLPSLSITKVKFILVQTTEQQTFKCLCSLNNIVACPVPFIHAIFVVGFVPFLYIRSISV